MENWESPPFSTTLGWVSVLAVLDTIRQLLSYEVALHSKARSSLIVLMSESLKLLLLFIVLARRQNELVNIHRFSKWLIVPAGSYAINNNIFYYGITLVSPPIWSILTQMRIIFLGLVYRLFLKRYLSPYQWIGLFILTSGVLITAGFGNDFKHDTLTASNLIIATILAIVTSSFSALGPIIVEWKLKNDENRSFLVQQFQLTGLCLLSSAFVFILDTFQNPIKANFLEAFQNSFVFLVILVTCICGLTVAAVMKYTDNVVKIYSQSLSTILTTVLCTILYPKTCQIQIPILISLFLTIIGIAFYEYAALSKLSISAKIFMVCFSFLSVAVMSIFVLHKEKKINYILMFIS